MNSALRNRLARFAFIRPARLFAPLLALLMLLSIGCGDRQGPPADGSKSGAGSQVSAASSPARALLERAMKKYSEAASYADAGELRESVTTHGQNRESEPFPFSISFARPNKLRFHSLAATVVCDGEHVWGAVLSPANDGQVLLSPAPPQLKIGHVFADPTLTLAAQGNFQIQPPQLAWLLSDAAPQLPAGAVVEQLPDAKLPDGDALCHRIQVSVDGDPGVYWLDAETLMLRRFEFPTKRIAAQADPDATGENFKIWAEFKAAQFQPKLPAEAFAFEAPASAQLVKRFVGPPPPPPLPILGRAPGQFSFFDMQGHPVTSESLQGKVVALEMFVIAHSGYQRSLPQFEKVYQKFAKNPKVAILAVNDDAADVPDDSVSKALDAIKFHAPLVRDRSEAYKSVFQLEGWPTIVLIGADGVVEYAAAIQQDEESDGLSKKIDALLAGKSLYADEIEQYERVKRRHESEMAEVLVGATREFEIPQAEVAPASELTKLKRSKLWTCMNIKSPGNLLVIDVPVDVPADTSVVKPVDEPADASAGGQADATADGLADAPADNAADAPADASAETPTDAPAAAPSDTQPDKPTDASTVKPAGETKTARRLLVIEAARNVVEIDPADGHIVARHTLDLPTEAAISYLRTAVDGAGNRLFAVFASGQQQVFVYDANWKLRVAYPSEGKHPGLADVLLADLDGDGQLELQIAYWGSVGVQTASLDGKRLRANRTVENVLRLAVVGPNSEGQSRLLCSSGGKSLVMLDSNLAKAGEIPTPDRSIHAILPHMTGNSFEIAALSNVEIGVTTALGLGLDGHEYWTYDLPRGVARYPVEAIALIPLQAGAEATWLLPGADGSLHFLGSDGQLIDRFNYGRLTTGVGGVEIEGKATLLVATPEDLTAWAIEAP